MCKTYLYADVSEASLDDFDPCSYPSRPASDDALLATNVLMQHLAGQSRVRDAVLDQVLDDLLSRRRDRERDGSKNNRIRQRQSGTRDREGLLVWDLRVTGHSRESGRGEQRSVLGHI